MTDTFPSVCILGLGYIGLPTASIMATRGFSVLGVDVSQRVVDTINRGEIHIVEPELDALVKTAVGSGRLRAALAPAPADVFIVAVPTPFKDGHQPDLTYVETATRNLAPHLKPGSLVILESTSPVGTTERMGEIIRALRPDLEVPAHAGIGSRPQAIGNPSRRIHLAHCPERVLPGQILRELVENDRIIGGIDAESTAHCTAIYRRFVNGKLLTTDSRTAEMAKLTENSFRDVNIAFANELSVICHRLGIDVWQLIALANHHPRVKILSPGPGVGGHCIAVDPWFIVAAAPAEARLIRTAREVNDAKPGWVIDRVREACAGIANPSIACLGLAFKADVDDIRESPAMHIVQDLARAKIGRIVAVEPYLDELPKSLANMDISWSEVGPAIAKADVVLLLVDHRPFKEMSVPLGKRIVDTRGLWKASAPAAQGARQ